MYKWTRECGSFSNSLACSDSYSATIRISFSALFVYESLRAGQLQRPIRVTHSERSLGVIVAVMLVGVVGVVGVGVRSDGLALSWTVALHCDQMSGERATDRGQGILSWTS